MGLKRRGTARKQVLDLSEKSNSPRQSWQTKYQQICEEHNSQNGDSPETGASVLPVTGIVTATNPLSGLIANYNSDSDADDGCDQAADDMNSKVSDFLKEIQTIVPSGSSIVVPGQPLTTPGLGPEDMSNQPQSTAATSAWQECYDETSGYAYYWNVATNEVTWETPADYLPEPAPTAAVDGQSQAETYVVPSQPSAQHWPQVPYPAIIPSSVAVHTPAPHARNKFGRKVATKSTYPVINKSAKGRPTSDSEDERIEMITSFGQSSEESEDEVTPPLKKKKKLGDESGVTSDLIGPLPREPGLCSPPPAMIGPTVAAFTAASTEDAVGPPGIEPNELTAVEVSGDVADKALNTDVIVAASAEARGQEASTPAESDDSEECTETDEVVILSRLRSQALLLKELGGDVPDEIRHLIEPQPETETLPVPQREPAPEPQTDAGADSIDFDKELEQMERELLEITEARKSAAAIVDAPSIAEETEEVSVSTEAGCPRSAEAVKVAKTPSGAGTPGPKKPTSFALIAGYGDDSEPEEETPEKIPPVTPVVKRTFQSLPTIPVKTLFPIFEETAVVTAITETKDDVVTHMSPAAASPEAMTQDVSPARPFKAAKTDFTIAALRSREPTPEPEAARTVLPMIDTSMPVKAGKRKKRLDISTSAELVARATVAAAAKASEEQAREETEVPVVEDGRLEENAVVFVKAETAGEESDAEPNVEDKKALEAVKREEAEARKNVEELAELIMEKVEFLGEGKDPVSPVQVMAIQIETLVSAWHKGALAQSYLSKRLSVTWEELRRLETAAAPAGWTCQWDRSHKRYYYHNILTDETRWEYPEEEPATIQPPPPPAVEKPPPPLPPPERESGGIAGGEQAMEICTTPPPPPSPPPSPLPATPPRIVTPPPPIITDPEPTPPPPPRISPFPSAKTTSKKGKGKRKHKVADNSGTSKSDATTPPLPPLPPPPPDTPPPPPPELPPLPPSPPPAPPSRLAYGEPLPPGVDPVDLPYMPPLYDPLPTAAAADLSATGQGQMMGLMQHTMQAYMMPTYQPPMVAAASIGAPMMDYGYMMHTHMAVPAVIAKPPAKKHKAALHAALDSFYSDLATMEPPIEEAPVEAPPVVEEVALQKVEVAEVKPVEVASVKKKKVKKVSAGLGLNKKKGVSSLVAKWQQVQQEVRRDYKTLDEDEDDDT